MPSDVNILIGAVAMLAAVFALFGYPVGQYRSLRKMRGMWLILACLPLPVMAYIVVVTIMALNEGSNLWPLLFIFAAPPAWIYLLLLQFAHHHLARKPEDQTTAQARVPTGR